MPSSRYRAFISYSQKDRQWGARLHRWLESYPVPPGVDVELGRGRRLGRFFRDDDEMPAASDIGERIRRAVDDSESLIVICSPRSAKSLWVAAEIRYFRKTGRGNRVFAFIIDGIPNSGNPRTECFPAPLRAAADFDPAAGLPIEPVGVDVRKDGRDRACARLAAGLLDVDFDELWRRDRRRAAVRQRWLVGGLSAATVSFGGLAVAAVMNARAARESAQRAEAARANLLADTSARFLAEGNGAKSLGYAAASLDIVRASKAGGEVAARAERAVRQALTGHDHTTLRLACTYRSHAGRVTDVALSTDERWLASAGDDGTIRIYHYASGELVKEVAHDGPVACLAFFDGDRSLLSASATGTLKATSVEGGGDSDASLGTRLRGMRPTPAGDAVLAWGLSGQLALWHPRAGQLEEIPLATNHPVLAVEPLAGDPDRVYLDQGNSGAVVSLRERKQLHGWLGMSAGRQVERGLAAFASNDAVEVADLLAGRIACTIAVAGVMDGAIAAEADRIAVMTAGPSSIELWSLSECSRIAVHSVPVSGIALAPGQKKLVAWTGNGFLAAYALDDGREIFRIETPLSIAGATVSDPAGRVLLWSSDGRAGVWSLSDGTLVKSIDGRSAVRSSAFNTAGQSVWLARESGELQIVPLDPDAIEARMLHDDTVLGWRFSRENDVLTWAADGTARRWTADPSPFGYLTDLTRYRPGMVEIDRDGTTIFAASGTQVTALRLSDGQQLDAQQLTGDVTGLVPSLDGRAAVINGQGGRCVWSLGGGAMTCAPITTQAFPFGTSRFVFFSPTPERVTAIDASRPDQGFVELAGDAAYVALSPRRRAAAVCPRSGGVLVYTDDVTQPAVTLDPGRPAISCAVSDERNAVATIDDGGTITVFQLDGPLANVTDRWSPPVTVPVQNVTPFNRIAYGRHITFAGRQGRILWIDPDEKRIVRDEVLQRPLSSAEVSDDLERIAVQAEGDTAFLFDRNGGTPLPLTHRSNILGLSFLSRRKVATWSADRTVRVWNAVTGQPELELAHLGIVAGLVETPDHTGLVAWTDQRELVQWDLAGGFRLLELRFPDAIREVRFLPSPDRMLIAFSAAGPMVHPYLSRQQLGTTAASLLDRLRPFSPGELQSIRPAADPRLAPSRERRIGSAAPPAAEGFLRGFATAIELGILRDGMPMLVSDRGLTEVVQLVEYNEFDQLVTLYATDGTPATLSLPLPPRMLASLRRANSIILYSLFPDHPPIGYRIPLVRALS